MTRTLHDTPTGPGRGADSQLLKGALTLAILTICDGEEQYARELVTELRGKNLRITLGTVYPALARMESKGLLGSRLVESTAGPARRYYFVTDAGRTQLAVSLKAWRSMTEAVEAVLAENPTVSPRTRRRATPGRTPAVYPGTTDDGAVSDAT